MKRIAILLVLAVIACGFTFKLGGAKISDHTGWFQGAVSTPAVVNGVIGDSNYGSSDSNKTIYATRLYDSKFIPTTAGTVSYFHFHTNTAGADVNVGIYEYGDGDDKLVDAAMAVSVAGVNHIALDTSVVLEEGVTYRLVIGVKDDMSMTSEDDYDGGNIGYDEVADITSSMPTPMVQQGNAGTSANLYLWCTNTEDGT